MALRSGRKWAMPSGQQKGDLQTRLCGFMCYASGQQHLESAEIRSPPKPDTVCPLTRSSSRTGTSTLRTGPGWPSTQTRTTDCLMNRQ